MHTYIYLVAPVSTKTLRGERGLTAYRLFFWFKKKLHQITTFQKNSGKQRFGQNMKKHDMGLIARMYMCDGLQVGKNICFGFKIGIFVCLNVCGV